MVWEVWECVEICRRGSPKAKQSEVRDKNGFKRPPVETNVSGLHFPSPRRSVYCHVIVLLLSWICWRALVCHTGLMTCYLHSWHSYDHPACPPDGGHMIQIWVCLPNSALLRWTDRQMIDMLASHSPSDGRKKISPASSIISDSTQSNQQSFLFLSVKHLWQVKNTVNTQTSVLLLISPAASSHHGSTCSSNTSAISLYNGRKCDMSSIFI